MDFDKEISIFKEIKVVIVIISVMGSMEVMLKYDKFCNGIGCVEVGFFLEGEILGLIGSMVGIDNLELYIK